MASIGEKIRTIRRKRGLTQSQLAEKCNVSRQQICSYEGNKMDPPALMLVTISNALGVTPDILLEDSINVPDTSRETITQLICMMLLMDVGLLRNLVDIINGIQGQAKKESESEKRV